MKGTSGNRILRQEKFDNYTYELRMITCGKANCGKCPHGPYWYVTIALRNGRTVKRYLGKETPAAILALEEADRRQAAIVLEEEAGQ